MSTFLNQPKTKVGRVLLMVQGPDSGEGDVYDLTALVAEMFERAPYGASINVTVKADYAYDGGGRKMATPTIEYGGDAGEWVHGATHIADVVNFGMKDGEAVDALKKRADRLARNSERKVRDLRYQAMEAKLRQVAAVRHQHPIAKFTTNDIPDMPAPLTLPPPTT